jgi:hypothetical protein
VANIRLLAPHPRGLMMHPPPSVVVVVVVVVVGVISRGD